MSEQLPAVDFFAPSRSSWILTDYQLLQGLTSVNFVAVQETNFCRWWRATNAAPVGYFWFGSFRHWPYLLWFKLTGRKALMVAGGYDVNNVPEIGYGAFQENRLRRMVRRLLFHLADKVLAVSRFAERLVLENVRFSDASRVRCIYLPIAIPPTEPLPWSERGAVVVFLISTDEANMLAKGVDRIPTLCKLLPEIQFKLAGALSEPVVEFLQRSGLSNLQILGPLPFHSPPFFNLLNKAKVICCPSRTESFGAAVLDGALMGCWPVAFRTGALPETLDNFGTLVDSGDVKAMAEAIQSVIDMRECDFKAAVLHIIRRFSPEVRAAELRQVLREML